MFFRPLFRMVPDGTRIPFMRGRIMGLVVSAVLSTISVALFFYPGLNLGIDFKGEPPARPISARSVRRWPRKNWKRACSASAEKMMS